MAATVVFTSFYTVFLRVHLLQLSLVCVRYPTCYLRVELPAAESMGISTRQCNKVSGTVFIMRSKHHEPPEQAGGCNEDGVKNTPHLVIAAAAILMWTK